MRSTETTVTFRRPFTLLALDGSQPAGTYRLVTDEEEILGLSFLAYQRAATVLHIPALSLPDAGLQRIVVVDPVELAAALDADAQAPPDL